MSPPLLVVSTGCPASIGPEVSLAAALRTRGVARVLVGNARVLARAAKLLGSDPAMLEPITEQAVCQGPRRAKLYVLDTGPRLRAGDCRPQAPSAAAGAAQLHYVETAYRLASAAGGALVTAAVSKAVIARSGVPGAEEFRGHTEWLQTLDGAPSVTMCFVGKRLASSLVTTHLRLADVSTHITSDGVTRATVHLVEALERLGRVPRIAVTALNPHAGEDELLGSEEARVIVPGVAAARRKLGRRAYVQGPIGAETAFRYARAGDFDGVVAMYHDQATVPMKLLDFGSAVNVTMGLSCVRTSVDHGTAYDIAWQGCADAAGMRAAMSMARRLLGGA